MIKIKIPHIFHVWTIIQNGNYDILGIASPVTVRMCEKCGKKQALFVECLGLNPPEYYRHWETLK